MGNLRDTGEDVDGVDGAVSVRGIYATMMQRVSRSDISFLFTNET